MMSLQCQMYNYLSDFWLIADYSVGFGGKYGVQTDRKDESAVGWEYKEKLHMHESQKGNNINNLTASEGDCLPHIAWRSTQKWL